MSAPAKRINFNKFRRSFLFLEAVFSILVVDFPLFGWSLIDAVYMVVNTMFEVGIGEVHPPTTTGDSNQILCSTALPLSFFLT